jgi:hypothetical protein
MNNSLPPLPPGNIWVGVPGSLGNPGVATPLAPGVPGSIFSIDPAGMPAWTTTLPSGTSVPANQITSGTLQPGTVITAGNGSAIAPTGTGVIEANKLSGSGVNKYSGSIPIPQNAIQMNISYPGLTASSTVLVSIIDPSGQTDQVSVWQKTPGVGFTVMFSGFYPTTTGSLNYLVIN